MTLTLLVLAVMPFQPSSERITISYAVRGTPQGISEQDTRDAAMWAVTTWAQALLMGVPAVVEERPWSEAEIRIQWDAEPDAPQGGSAVWPPLDLWPREGWTVRINSSRAMQVRPPNGACYFPGPIWRGVLLHEIGHNFGCADHPDGDLPCGAMRSATPWLSDEDRAELNVVWAAGRAAVHGAPDPRFPLLGRVE